MSRKLDTTYYSEVMRLQPTAYYRLGELSGTTAKDSSSNGYDGTLNGTVTEGVAGALIGDPNAGMSFDGSSGYIALPSGLSTTGATLLCVAFWLKITTTNYGGDARIMANSHTDSDNNGFQLYIKHFTHTPLLLDFQIGNGSAALDVQTVGPPTMVVGTWYHFVFIYDTAGIRAYVNGVLNNTNASASFGAMNASGNPINLGRNPAYNGDYFSGSLDEVAFFIGKTLTADQIAWLYQVGLGAGAQESTHRPLSRLL